MTAPRPTVTSLEILPVYGQSENRSRNDAPALAQAMDAAVAGQVYSTHGLQDMHGAGVGPDGAGWTGSGLNSIDQDEPATGFAAASGLGRVSPAFTLQRARALRQREIELPLTGPSRGVVIADHGYGGRRIAEWAPQDASPLGRNQLYWMAESKRLADEFGVAISCPYTLLFQGSSARNQPGPAYRAEFEAAHAATVQQATALFDAAPRLVVVVNGGAVDTSGDLGAIPGAQYRIAQDHGGIVATWQRVFPVVDRHMQVDGRTQVLIGETCEWAISEVEAGRDWNIGWTVGKSGAEVQIGFTRAPARP